MTSEKEQTLREIIDWCEQQADKQYDMYRAYEDERQAIAVRGAYWVVACHCRQMLGQPTQEDAK